MVHVEHFDRSKHNVHRWSLRSLCAGKEQVTRLRYTPRKFVVHPETNMLVVAEADHAAVPLAERSTDNMEDGQGALPQVCPPQQRERNS